MKPLQKLSLLGLSMAFLFSGSNLLAAAPTGMFTIEFDDPSLRIWDPTGSYTESLDTGGDDWDIAYTLNVDGGGNLTGAGTFDLYSCALGACISLDGNFNITGKMSGGGDTVRVKMNFDMAGSGYFQGYDLYFYAKMNVNAEINTATSAMIGTIGGKVKVEIPGEGKGGASVPKSEFHASMPAGSDGMWTLVLHLEQPIPEKPDQLAGSAMIELSSGLTMALNEVKGKYKEKTDETKIAIKGSKEQVESKGVNLKIETLPGGGLDLKKFKGKVSKQKMAIDTTKMERRHASQQTSTGGITSGSTSLGVSREWQPRPDRPLPPPPPSSF